MKKKFQAIWEVLREQRIGDVVDKAKAWADAVKFGADPIEAMHGHLCGPGCMHWDTMTDERRKLLMKAPWNKGKKA